MAKTAIIGLGAMGYGMACRMMGQGISLSGYDVAEPACARFADAGGAACDTAAAAAQGADLLILMVQNAAQARAALFDEGAADAMARPGTVVLCSTVAPSESRELGAALAELGLGLLDAPVSGGQVAADAGTLTVMASGAADDFARADAMLKAVAKPVHHLGDTPGMGATYKVVHQLAAGVHLAAAAEVLSLGAKAGCDPDKLFEILTTSAGSSWMLGNRGPRMMQDDPERTSSVDIFVKDVGLVLQLGRENSMPLPLSAAAHQLFLSAQGLGHGNDDDSHVIRVYEAITGVGPRHLKKREPKS